VRLPGWFFRGRLHLRRRRRVRRRCRRLRSSGDLHHHRGRLRVRVPTELGGRRLLVRGGRRNPGRTPLGTPLPAPRSRCQRLRQCSRPVQGRDGDRRRARDDLRGHAQTASSSRWTSSRCSRSTPRSRLRSRGPGRRSSVGSRALHSAPASSIPRQVIPVDPQGPWGDIIQSPTTASPLGVVPPARDRRRRRDRPGRRRGPRGTGGDRGGHGRGALPVLPQRRGPGRRPGPEVPSLRDRGRGTGLRYAAPARTRPSSGPTRGARRRAGSARMPGVGRGALPVG